MGRIHEEDPGRIDWNHGKTAGEGVRKQASKPVPDVCRLEFISYDAGDGGRPVKNLRIQGRTRR